MSDPVNQRRDDSAKNEADAHMSDCTIAYLVHHHSASACKDQDKRANAFGVSFSPTLPH
jgi:hypothetical protein